MAQVLSILSEEYSFCSIRLFLQLQVAFKVRENACLNSRFSEYTLAAFDLKDKTGVLEGVICYPPGWDRDDNSRCVVYHNPNAITVAEFFEDGRLSYTAGEILNLKQCPVILYDYRGTGLNQGDYCSSSLRFRPTYATIVEDGLTVIDHTLKKFKHVDIWGSSLGGGVSTVSLERHLSKNSDDAQRVSITNHDSFTTTPRVVLPNNPMMADCLGWLFGGNLNAH